MTVKAIRLQNFMAFEDTDWIELRPINLLFGRNSSGKSVIIRALRLLKQSLFSQNKALVLFADEKLNLGLFREIIHNQQPDAGITFHFRCQLSSSLSERLRTTIEPKRQAEEPTILGAFLRKNSEGEIHAQVDFSLSFSESKDKKVGELTLLQICCPWAISEESEGTFLTAEKLLGLNEKWYLQRGDLLPEITDEDDELWQTTSIEIPIGFLPELKFLDDQQPPPSHYLQLGSALLSTLRESVQGFLEKIEYLAPLRPEPQRTYMIDEVLSERLQLRGLSAWLEFLRDEVDSEKVTEIERWLDELGLGHKLELSPNKYDDLVTLSQVKIHENQRKNLDPINLSHLGFGASQVLPVIVQSVLAKEGSLIIIEQPELHLHPSAQAILGDLFIQMTSAGVRLVIETHSENLLLRFRRRIAQTSGRVPEAAHVSLERADLKAYFVGRQNGISTIEALRFNEWGDYEYRPPGFGDFFGQDFEELMKMKKARRGQV